MIVRSGVIGQGSATAAGQRIARGGAVVSARTWTGTGGTRTAGGRGPGRVTVVRGRRIAGIRIVVTGVTGRSASLISGKERLRSRRSLSMVSREIFFIYCGIKGGQVMCKSRITWLDEDIDCSPASSFQRHAKSERENSRARIISVFNYEQYNSQTQIY